MEAAMSPTNDPDRPVLDLDRALDRMEGSREMLRELAELYLSESPGWLREAEEASAAGDAEALTRAAHDIKGSSDVFAADAATRTAEELERMGRGGDLEGADAVVERLRLQVERVREALSDFLGDAG